MRNVGEVVDRMLEKIPVEDTLAADLHKMMQDAAYKAPEQMREVWGEGGMILYSRFGETMPTEGWEKEIVDIWLGKA